MTFKNQLKIFFTENQLNILQNAKVAILGAGGLGSNIANNLVRSGIKRLLLVDYDIVEAGNLNRQFFFADQIGFYKTKALKENLLRINESALITVENTKVDADNINSLCKNYDYVFEAFDCAKSKALLINSLINEDKVIISGNGMAGYGNTDKIVTKKAGDNIYIVGDFSSDIKDQPPLCPRVTLVAAKMADLLLAILLSQ